MGASRKELSSARPIAVLGLLSVSLTACAAETEEVPLALELGGGSWRFEALAEGQDVDMILGAQGGWHVWLAVRVSGMSSPEARLTVRTQPTDQKREPHVHDSEITLVGPDSEGRLVYVGWPEVLIEPGCLVDVPLHIRAELSGAAGETLFDERTLVPRGGAYPPPACEGPER